MSIKTVAILTELYYREASDIKMMKRCIHSRLGCIMFFDICFLSLNKPLELKNKKNKKKSHYTFKAVKKGELFAVTIHLICQVAYTVGLSVASSLSKSTAFCIVLLTVSFVRNKESNSLQLLASMQHAVTQFSYLWLIF